MKKTNVGLNIAICNAEMNKAKRVEARTQPMCIIHWVSSIGEVVHTGSSIGEVVHTCSSIGHDYLL